MYAEFEGLGSLCVLAECLQTKENMRTSKHGYAVDIVEVAIAFFIECSPDVRD